MKKTYKVHRPYKVVANENAGNDVDTVATFVDRCKTVLDKLFGDEPSIKPEDLPTTIDEIEVSLDGQKLRFAQGENVAHKQCTIIDDEVYQVAGVDLVASTSVEETGDDTDRQVSDPANESFSKWKEAIKRYRAKTNSDAEEPAMEMYKIVEDEAYQTAATEMYEIIEEDQTTGAPAMEMYKIVEDNQEPATENVETMRYKVVSGETATESAPDNATYEIVPDVSEIGATESVEDLLTEYQAVTKMKDSEFSGISAIESMPNVYKHLWHSLSKPGKIVVARRAKAIPADESAILKFWSDIDFIAVERAVLAASSDVKLEVGVESVQDTYKLNRKIAFLKNKL